MTVNIDELTSVVSNLNELLFNKEFFNYTFSYTTDGYYQSISFLGLDIWNSENDERDWIQNELGEDIDLEPLFGFCLKELKMYKDLFDKILN